MLLPVREAEVTPLNTKLISLREGWLEAMVHLLNDHLRICGVATDDTCRVSCGFPLSRRGHPAERIGGQCFAPKYSRDNRPQIFINPTIDDSIAVASVLLHELIHAGIGSAFDHGRIFSQAARQVGLLKPWVSAQISDDLLPILQGYVEVLGPYPHAAILRSCLSNHPATGSRSRLRLFECNCVPVVKARVARDEFLATCEVCHCRFHRVS